MNQDFDIFSAAKPQDGEFAKWKNIGDSVQGTYIDSRKGVDSFGNHQTIYVLQEKDGGKVWNAAFNDMATVIHEKMNTVRYGQIVGFRFDEEKDSKKMPGKKAKIIRIYADSRLVDEEWLAAQQKLELGFQPKPTLEQASNILGGKVENDSPFQDNHFSAPDNASPVSSSVAKDSNPPVVEKENDSLIAIRNLASTKGLTNNSMSVTDADAVIEAYIGCKLTEENLPKAIMTIAGYVAK